MNLISVYNFSLNGNNFFFEINWNFNIFYLKIFRLEESIFIDSSLHYFDKDCTSTLIASEIDYGNFLDCIDLLVQKTDSPEYQEISSKLLKNNKSLKLNFKNDIKIIELDKKALKEIKKLKIKIVEDFKIFSSKIDLIEDIILLTDRV